MHYIYCYENKTNGKCYVGQTSNIERRNKEHMSRAFDYLANETGTLFHQMLRKVEVHVDAETVSRINKGLTHKDENLNYPLR